MKLHILSDLHTEFADFWPPNTEADVVILAGDIGVGLEGVEWAGYNFPDTPVIYVPGNHEYYRQDIELIEKLVRESAENIHVLNNAELVLDGVRFLGATLWTDFMFDGESEAWFSRRNARDMIADFSLIKQGDARLTPESSAKLHRQSKSWLKSRLEQSFDGPTVVVTHHLPAAMSVAPQYKDSPVNSAFVSHLEGLIEAYRPRLWVHGHTHVACDYELFDTRVVCNPRGYPNESDSHGFRSGFTVSV